MFIYWGTKERTKYFGNTAHFCKICNDITVSTVSERQEVGHLYLIPMGKYKFVHTELECLQCKKVLVTTIKSEDFNYQKTDDLKTLKAGISHDLISEWETEREQKISMQKDPSSLTKDERFEIIYDAFRSFENQVRLKFNQPSDIKFSKRFLPGCLTIILIISIIILIESLGFGNKIQQATGLESIVIGFCLIIPIGFIQLIWCALTFKSNYFKTEVFPSIIKTIGHLKPTLQELILVQEKLKKEKFEMRKFSISKFQLALSESQLGFKF